MKELSILKQYRLHPRTFLEIKPLLQGDINSSWGKLNYTLTEADKTLLSCMGVHPITFTQRTKLLPIPFFRYLLFLCFTVPENEFKNYLIHRNIIHETNTVALDLALVYRDSIIKYCLPVPLRKYARKAQEPPKKFKPLWENIAYNMNIMKLFTNPEALSEFDAILLDRDSKTNLEVFLTTEHNDLDLLTTLKNMAGLDWTMSQLHDYKSWFYDLTYINDDAWVNYLTFLIPQEAVVKDNVFSKDLSLLKLEKGLVMEDNIDVVVDDALKKFTQAYYEGMLVQTADGDKRAKDALDTILKIKDTMDTLHGGKSVIEELYNIFDFDAQKEDITESYLEKFNKTKKNDQDPPVSNSGKNN